MAQPKINPALNKGNHMTDRQWPFPTRDELIPHDLTDMRLKRIKAEQELLELIHETLIFARALNKGNPNEI